MSIVDRATSIAMATVRGIQSKALELERRVSFEGEGVRVRCQGIYGDGTYKWRDICQMAMIAAVLDREITIEMKGDTINPIITGQELRAEDVFLAVNTQIFNFLSQQPPIASHVAMCRRANNNINDPEKMFAEILNLYTDGTYHGTSYPRDAFMYFYYSGQMVFQLYGVMDTFRVGIRDDYDRQYVADRYEILERVSQEFLRVPETAIGKSV
ncbi:hypothetical protein pEaSNUABM5_00036 [Erwinia phage pEa_SNUABM_5]|uniref:Uncharacterized protein n=1 Tax=Erwinia phage pEa_SNUABM_5 TaxID=2797313 RepID=A0A7T8EPA9_9CAUD|nr:hypothetical protein MPK73_gp036 [Erwinia phage pEa_SNUABM_5]QQO90178.1 hypothetical protein pEaSNUABM5_00036 [Erwinia phage pEa_SNUABM_5]